MPRSIDSSQGNNRFEARNLQPGSMESFVLNRRQVMRYATTPISTHKNKSSDDKFNALD